MLRRDLTEMLREQVAYRDLLYQMTRRDLILRYKQTAMGVAWAVFSPLINTLIFSVIFTKVAPVDVGIPYPLYAYSGFWIWTFFASSLKFSVTSLTGNMNLVTKVYFPREIFPMSALIVSFVDFLVASVPLAVMMIYYRVPVGVALFCLPVIVLIQIVFTLAVALLLSMWNLFYRDVKYVFDVVIAVAVFATSAVLPAPNGFIGTLVWLNPMTAIIESYRAVLLRAEWPALVPLLAVGAVSLALLLWAWVAFHRSEFEFAENV